MALCFGQLGLAATGPDGPGVAVLSGALMLGVAAAVCLWGLLARARAEKARQAAEQEAAVLRSALGAGGTGLLALDRWRRPIYVSDALSRLMALDGPLPTLDALGAPQALGPDNLKRLDKELDGLVASGRPFALRLRLPGARGVLQVKGRRTPGTLSTGQMLVLSVRDITQDAEAAAHSDQAAEQLGTENDRLRSLLDAAPFPIWQHNLDLKLVYANRAFVAAVGAQSENEVLNRQTELVPPIPSGGTGAVAEKARDTGRLVVERHYGVVDGHRRAMSITGVPLADGVVGFSIDVNNEEEARSELVRHLQSQAELLNLLSTPVAIFRPDQRLRFFNTAFSQLTGLSEDYLGLGPALEELLQAMHERRRLPEQADFAAWKRGRAKLFRELIEAQEEMWHLPDGTSLRVVTQPNPMGGVMMVLEDVSRDLELKRSYNTQIAVQRETLNNLAEAVGLFGSDGRLKLFNPAFSGLWNLEPGFLGTEPHADELLDRAQPLIDDGRADWIETKGRWLNQLIARTPSEGRVERSDGRVVDWAVVPLPDGRTLVTTADVTEAVSYQRALRERNEALETADQLKTEFVANMSYELRTPLNSIIGFTRLLLDHKAASLDARTQEYLSYIRESADQLGALIDSILDLALIEAGGMTLDMTDFDICGLLDDLTRSMEKQLKVAHIGTELACDRTGIGRMHGDRRRILQALQNLVANSVSLTPPGGRLEIGAVRQKSMIEFWVADNGVGMDKHEVERLLKPGYTRYIGSNRDRHAGLGLPLVQSFVQLHGGVISIDSKRGQGTKVVCRLPAQAVQKMAS